MLSPAAKGRVNDGDKSSWASSCSRVTFTRRSNKGKRALRDERQRGRGPPYVRDGRNIWYPVQGFLEWMRANEVQPVRAEPLPAPKPQPAPRALRREAAPIAARKRKRQREFETTA